MKYKLLFFLIIIPIFVKAQKPSYIKDRFTFDISYMQTNYCFIPEYIEKRSGVSLSANYGITKFMESGLYYYRYNSAFSSFNFTGIQNKFHILPFFVESNNKYFRLDAFVFNQTGISITKHLSNQVAINYNSDIGIGTSLFLFKHIGVNFKYKWGFILSKHIEKHNFQNGFDVGLVVKF